MRHRSLFDDSIGAAEQQHGDCDAKRFGRHLIDEQLDFCDLLNRQQGRPFALEDSTGIGSGLLPRIVPRC